MEPVEPKLQRELEATVEARRELGSGHDDELVAGFLDRIEGEVDRRVDERVARRVPQASDRGASIPIVLGSLGLSIPLLAVAGGAAGLAGIALVCLAIVLVNLAALRR